MSKGTILSNTIAALVRRILKFLYQAKAREILTSYRRAGRLFEIADAKKAGIANAKR